MNNYSVTIDNASKELTKAECVKFKDLTNAIKLDEATREGEVIIDVDFYIELNVHNDKADPCDYKNFIVVDKTGKKYVTGSKSFWNAFADIANEMDGEEYQVIAYRLPSKNYKGKDFLTCSLA